MKKILFTLSIFLFFACVSNDDKAKIDGANQFVSGIEKFEKNKELADKGFDTFESGDLEGLFALVSDDLIWNPPHIDSLSKEDYVSGMKGWHSEFENFKFTERQYFPGVDDSLYLPNGSVRAYGVWKYNHKASGTEFSTKYYSVSEFDETGLQTTIYEFFDRGDIFLKLQ